MGNRQQVIHMNWIRPLVLEDILPSETLTWEPPLFTHDELAEEENDSPAPEGNDHNPPLERAT